MKHERHLPHAPHSQKERRAAASRPLPVLVDMLLKIGRQVVRAYRDHPPSSWSAVDPDLIDRLEQQGRPAQPHFVHGLVFRRYDPGVAWITDFGLHSQQPQSEDRLWARVAQHREEPNIRLVGIYVVESDKFVWRDEMEVREFVYAAAGAPTLECIAEVDGVEVIMSLQVTGLAPGELGHEPETMH
jgi:hypothetical protein